MEISIRLVVIVIMLVVVALVVISLFGVFGGTSTDLLKGLFDFFGNILGGQTPTDVISP